MPVKRHAIIVAGGSGSRFGEELPKQFQLLAGRPVLYHSIFLLSRVNAEVIVVLPADRHAYWKSLLETHELPVDHVTVPGGDSRTESVRKGLDLVRGAGLVAVHDAARPLASPALAESVFSAAAKHGSAIPVVPVDQSLRKIEGDSSMAVDRSAYRLVQTPQCFDAGKLKAAYDRAPGKTFTDDATAYEAAGHEVFLVKGERSNIKITASGDLGMAETLYRSVFV